MRLRKREMNRLLLVRQLDPSYFLKLLDPALHLSCLGGLITEASDEGFQVMNMLLLISLVSFELRPSFRLLRQVTVIIARVEIRAPIPDLQDLVYRDIEE